MKTCSKCHIKKPLTEFYQHHGMADKHLSKCRVCTRKDTAANLAKRMLDPQFRIKEAARHRKKANKQRSKDGYKIDPVKRRDAIRKSRSKDPLKQIARNKVATAIENGTLNRYPCSKCGAINSEAHHEDYSKPLEVVWLCPKHHAERHVEINDAKRLLPN